MHIVKAVVLLAAVLLIAGCRRPAPVEVTTVPPAEEAGQGPTTTAAQPEKMKITAYINVTSKCQAATVALLNKLAMDHAEKVDLELVDFGSGTGFDRWRKDGLECMTILFNGSPVLKLPDPDGGSRVVVFAMPAGFSWTHEDLQDAFAAIEAGTVQVLSEDQAREELAPKPAKLETGVRQDGVAAIVQVNGSPALKIMDSTEDKAPLDRAKAAQQVIEAWASQPIHPSELTIASKDESTLVLAKGTPIVEVTQADAKTAGVADTKQLAAQWLAALKRSVVEAVAAAASQHSPPGEDQSG